MTTRKPLNMAAFHSVDNTDYIHALMNLCINNATTQKDFHDTLWISDPNECAEMFESTFGVTPFNYSATRRRTHPFDHTNKLFDFISKPEIAIETAMFWIAMTVYIIRTNISSPNPVNYVIDEEFIQEIYRPLVSDIGDMSDHAQMKEKLISLAFTLRSKLADMRYKFSFCDFFLRTLSSSDYVSPYCFP